MGIFYYNFVMNETYSMGLHLHSFAAVALLVVIFINLYLLISIKELKKYKRVHALFLQPLTFTIYGLSLFTGTIMMAAKHLDFTFANIVMLFVSLIFFLLELKRVKSLGYLSESKEHAFFVYKPIARTLLQIEFLLILILSLGMWLL